MCDKLLKTTVIKGLNGVKRLVYTSGDEGEVILNEPPPLSRRRHTRPEHRVLLDRKPPSTSRDYKLPIQQTQPLQYANNPQDAHDMNEGEMLYYNDENARAIEASLRDELNELHTGSAEMSVLDMSMNQREDIIQNKQDDIAIFEYLINRTVHVPHTITNVSSKIMMVSATVVNKGTVYMYPGVGDGFKTYTDYAQGIGDQRSLTPMGVTSNVFFLRVSLSQFVNNTKYDIGISLEFYDDKQKNNTPDKMRGANYVHDGKRYHHILPSGTSIGEVPIHLFKNTSEENMDPEMIHLDYPATTADNITQAISRTTANTNSGHALVYVLVDSFLGMYILKHKGLSEDEREQMSCTEYEHTLTTGLYNKLLREAKDVLKSITPIRNADHFRVALTCINSPLKVDREKAKELIQKTVGMNPNTRDTKTDLAAIANSADERNRTALLKTLIDNTSPYEPSVSMLVHTDIAFRDTSVAHSIRPTEEDESEPEPTQRRTGWSGRYVL